MGFAALDRFRLRRRNEERLQRQAQLLDLSGEAIFTWRLHGTIESWNEGAVALYGYSRQEAIGRVSHELLATQHLDGFPAVVTQLKRDGRWRGELIHRAKGGLAVIVESRLQLLRQGNIELVLETNRDITERKHAEAVVQASEERQRFLLTLSDAMRPLADAAEIQFVASRTLGEHLNASRVAYAEDCGDGETVELTRNYTSGVPGIEGRYRYADYGSALLAEMQAGSSVMRADIANDPRLTDAEKAAHAALQLGATLNVPLVKKGRLMAVFTVHYREAHDFTPDEVALVEEVAERTWAAVERARAEARLRESEGRLRAIIDTAADAIIVIDEKGCIQSINPAAERIFGYTSADMVGSNVSMLMDEPHRSAHDRYLRSFHDTGTAKVIGRGAEVEARRKDGTSFPADLSVVEWHLEGRRYFTGILHDTTERRQREEQVKLLLREINHRSKNLLQVVQAIASRTAATSNRDEFLDRFFARLAALAANQDLLIKSRWQGIELASLIRTQLAHFENLIGNRIVIEGPAVPITAEAAQTIGIAVHELVTNAGKYGALSGSDGTVSIAWAIGQDGTGEDRFHLDWTEHGGPEVHPPTRQGFGTTVIQHIPRVKLGAEIRHDYAPAGVTWQLSCPASRVLEHAGCTT
jgi:PAS domain S-box-containing protein